MKLNLIILLGYNMLDYIDLYIESQLILLYPDHIITVNMLSVRKTFIRVIQ